MGRDFPWVTRLCTLGSVDLNFCSKFSSSYLYYGDDLLEINSCGAVSVLLNLQTAWNDMRISLILHAPWVCVFFRRVSATTWGDRFSASATFYLTFQKPRLWDSVAVKGTDSSPHNSWIEITILVLRKWKYAMLPLYTAKLSEFSTIALMEKWLIEMPGKNMKLVTLETIAHLCSLVDNCPQYS